MKKRSTCFAVAAVITGIASLMIRNERKIQKELERIQLQFHNGTERLPD